MGEDLDVTQLPNFIPTDEELDMGFRKFADPFLTEDELKALHGKSDRGITLAPQYQFSTLEDFKKGQNNFHAYFDISNKGMGPMYRRRKAFQRFVALNPDLVIKTVEDYQRHREMDPFLDFSEEMWKDLFESYKQISTS
jgi:hypothetical protein